MYAVIRTGGRQYRVEKNMVLDVEKLPVQEGESFDIQEVLLLVPESGEPRIGQPVVSGASVQVTCVAQIRGEKIRVWKYRPKKRYRLRKGHRQYYTRLRVDGISG